MRAKSWAVGSAFLRFHRICYEGKSTKLKYKDFNINLT